MPSHVTEGITAYAFEQADDERERQRQWKEKWSDIRQRAVLVLEKFLGEKESDSIPSLRITIEDEGYDSDIDADEEEGAISLD